VFAIISPAKKLDFDPPGLRLKLTAPELFKETQVLSQTTRLLKTSDLKKLMKLSDPLARLNYERFQEFDAQHAKPAGCKQAALAFDGDTYQGLRAPEFTKEQMDYAQDHLGILSGLYGLLRPLDAISPYRLEMGTRLKTPRGHSLYDFWGDLVAKKINSRLKKIGTDVVVNLASKEYSSVIPAGSLKGRVITPVFQELRGGKPKIISFCAKRARGAMARYILQNSLQKPEDLRAFREDGYKFTAKGSTETEWFFLR
jgi:cytoplasmic iron level regulating protein YaaA (DUF328/UPF0246 family)